MTDYVIDEADMTTLQDYFTAALNGEENRLTIQRLFHQELGVIRSHPLLEIPDTLICQSLPDDLRNCGVNDCFCKEIQRVEMGGVCKWMQSNRAKQDGK